MKDTKSIFKVFIYRDFFGVHNIIDTINKKELTKKFKNEKEFINAMFKLWCSRKRIITNNEYENSNIYGISDDKSNWFYKKEIEEIGKLFIDMLYENKFIKNKNYKLNKNIVKFNDSMITDIQLI